MNVAMRGACTALFLFVGFAVCQVGDDCDFDEKSSIKLLRGEHGDKVKFKFTSLSLVHDQRGRRVYKYSRYVRNDHSTLFLPVEWSKASIEFEDVTPGKCYGNYFESGKRYEEETDTIIKYGTRKNQEAKAGILLPGKSKAGCSPAPGGHDCATCSEEMKMKLPALSSSIRGSSRAGRVQFAFQCSVEGASVTYTAWLERPIDTDGPSAIETLLFTAPALTQSALKDVRGEIDPTKQWKQDKSKAIKGVAYSVNTKKSGSEQLVRFPDVAVAAVLEESQVHVTLYTPIGKRIARGLVSVYLPRKTSKK